MFPLKEYHQRLHTLKKRMAHEGVEVLLISNPSNMYYLSNYSAWSFYVHQMMIVTLEDAQPIWIGRQMDAQGVSKTTWLDDHHIIPYPDYYVQSKEKHPMNFIVNILKEIGQSNRVIGIEMDAHYFTGLSYQQLTNGLPNATFKDTTTLVNMIRLIKSDREIECMRRAAKIVEQTMQAAYDKVNVGVRECDVAATIFHSQIQGTKDFGGDYTSIVPMLPTNEHTSCPHLTWTDQTYKIGDFLTLEIAGAYKRYHAPMARTMSLGPAPHKLKELSKVVEEGIQLTLDAIKPGMTAEEVETVWRKAIEKKGHTKASRLGYSVGLSFPPDWGEHTISFRQGDHSILKPNMTFHLMPGIWYEDYGIEITETILLTDKGVDTLTTFPRELYEKSCLRMSESV
ncbi:Xaa-Pro peptidase family protein [Halalkalibacter sp. APA_J-10(15)]|uniref:M24 family metallopeptidase n=1 Tax=Halalkalibacter sp. APA_J-10(15) TaxID=2933805 RepID=UPI001FF5855B|nr:Xaa-Pro peptidase family protein [Halalkalibacter sp. APA_J-10(15)]MCK0472043.1 Xaa-Pro peptidase family protein [Halalkalibacter sp. APA_J-10(15)]